MSARFPAIDRPLDPELIDRFRADLTRVWPDTGADAGADKSGREQKLGLAVSGGPDSVAMLLLAHAAIADRIEAVTVDHGLRAEAADEAALVARLCADLDVQHCTLPVTLPQGNVQQEARLARYHAMAGWMADRGLAALATAHHADDQAETLLMRLNRGSGIGGLAGIRENGNVPGHEAPLIRPLLHWRRSELAQVCNQAGVKPAIDPSNSDTKFDRVRIRKALQISDWLDPASFAVSAQNLAQADTALEWATDAEWENCVARADGGDVLTYRPSAPQAVRLRIIARILSEFGAAAPRGGAIARFVSSLEQGRPADLAGVRAVTRGEVWEFSAEIGRKN